MFKIKKYTLVPILCLADEYKSQISEKDLWDIEMKYQKELERLERENKELRKQILIRNSSSQPVKRVQVRLDSFNLIVIELYTH